MINKDKPLLFISTLLGRIGFVAISTQYLSINAVLGLTAFAIFMTVIADARIMLVVDPWLDQLIQTQTLQYLISSIGSNLSYLLIFLCIIATTYVGYAVARKLYSGKQNTETVTCVSKPPSNLNRLIPFIKILAGHGAYGLHPMTQVLQIAF